METKKTEYRGITFRSKSEAQFAFMLDHSSLCVSGWIYEPEEFKLPNGYVIDFLVFQKTKITIIEFKPSEPTELYLNQFKRNINEIIVKDQLDLIDGYTLIYGSVFTKYFYLDNGIFKSFDAFNEDLRNKAKNYRFDLK